VKAHHDFSNDPMIIFFQHKIKMKVDHKIQNINNLFLSCKLQFLMKHFFVMIFLCLGIHILFLLHCDLYSFKVLHNK
jgi:hypothetical protein